MAEGRRLVGAPWPQHPGPPAILALFRLRLYDPSNHEGEALLAREQRRLAAIVAADVVGYSRLMGRDESGTLARLREHRKQRLEPILARHGGRLVKLTGDGALSEFPSAVDAVSAAIEFQQAVAEANQDTPEATAIVFRVGVHLGDLIVDGDDLYGDGVNVAARLEAEALAGGVVVSGDVHNAVAGKVKVTLRDLGALPLKNIDRPVQAFRAEWIAEDWPVRTVAPSLSSARTASSQEAAPALALPDKPSVAVLPFQNMSGDPEQEYFADGMVEDIITALSRFKSLFVIARNSSFTYKGKAVDIKQVGHELGVRYVLEGSVRKAGGKVRITGQLIDAATGSHLWADRFDGDFADIFGLQDRITESIVGAIQPSLQRAEIARTSAKPTEKLDAYDLYLRAVEQFHGRTNAGSTKAVELLHRAIEIDPGYAIAKGLLAYVYTVRNNRRWAKPGEVPLAIQLAREVIASSSEEALALRTAGHAVSDLARDYGHAQLALERAVRINPNSFEVLTSAGWVDLHRGEPATAIDFLERAMRLSPLDPEMGFTAWGLCVGYLMVDRNSDALQAARRSVQEFPDYAPILRWMAFPLARLGRYEEAREMVRRCLELDPSFRVSTFTRQFRDQAFNDEYAAMLIACGAPE